MNVTTLASLGIALCFLTGGAAAQSAAPKKTPFLWENATVYFLLTDRFHNTDPSNDLPYGRKADGAPLRGYMGGDLAGVTAKIKEGYFDKLGVDVLWLTPPVEQNHSATDEGTGNSYGFHGYWAKDFTSVDANLGSEADVRTLVDTAHAHGIRVLLDVVMNHTGPITATDPAWPAEWVRTGPLCAFKDARSTTDCVLVSNLPDVLTGSTTEVRLPPGLEDKWRKEGRYEREVSELDAFFRRTGFPRTPRYYLIKWHADWVRKFGFDGIRGDTAKHTEAAVWKELKVVATEAHDQWKRANPTKRLTDAPFFMVAEVYNYSLNHGRRFHLGGNDHVDYLAEGFDSLINFSLKSDARGSYESLFSHYSAVLNGSLRGRSVLNYISSHDDGEPFDPLRNKAIESATKLLLAPGAAQIYYGDESARMLVSDGAVGDAKLRSFMNWDELAKNTRRQGYGVADIQTHWQLLGTFRKNHPSIGAGVHRKIQDKPYTFARTLLRDGIDDRVVVALDVPLGRASTLNVGSVFNNGTTLLDHYSGSTVIVHRGKVRLNTGKPVVLLAPSE